MKTKLTQKQRVEKRLLDVGYASRNEYINLPYHKILRLGSYINILRNEGWEIETKDDGIDCKYILKKCPYKIIRRTLANGQIIETIQR
jgi:hypothetical protein